MEYRGFEVFATAIPDEFLSEERKSGGTGKVFTCEIYAARDEGLANVLDVFDLVEGKDIPVDCEDLITPMRMRVDNHYEMLMEKSALSMDRFIKINGAVFSFEEVAQALGVECDPKREPVQLHLCQRVDDGVLVAKGAFFDKDDYPAIDVELQLPSEKDSLPVMISRTEQPRVEGEDHAVRNYCYSRENEYFMHFDVDSRPDAVVDRNGMEAPRVVVSGNPYRSAEVYAENHFVMYRGEVPVPERRQELDIVELKVGMVGIIKDEPGIKKALRGKAFEVIDFQEGDSCGAVCKIEGKKGTYFVYRDYMEDLKTPEQSLSKLDDLVSAAEKGNAGKKTEKEDGASMNEKDNGVRALAGRLVGFYKDFDFYEFVDSLEPGGEEEAVATIEKMLGRKDGSGSFVQSLKDIISECELDENEMATVMGLIKDLTDLEKSREVGSLDSQIQDAKDKENITAKISVPDKDKVELDL